MLIWLCDHFQAWAKPMAYAEKGGVVPCKIQFSGLNGKTVYWKVSENRFLNGSRQLFHRTNLLWIVMRHMCLYTRLSRAKIRPLTSPTCIPCIVSRNISIRLSIISIWESSSLSAQMGFTAAPYSGSPWWDRMRCWRSTDFSSDMPNSLARAATSCAPMTRWPRSWPFIE